MHRHLRPTPSPLVLTPTQPEAALDLRSPPDEAIVTAPIGPRLLSTRFSAAMLLAAELHASQRRKKEDRSIAYVSHLMSVAALVLEDGSENEAIAGLLHDAVEDQGLTEARMESEFGPRLPASSSPAPMPSPSPAVPRRLAATQAAPHRQAACAGFRRSGPAGHRRRQAAQLP